jgi:hypothetical protein
MNVLFLAIHHILHPWFDDVVDSCRGRHDVILYNPGKPLSDQFRDIDVVVIELQNHYKLHNFRGEMAGKDARLTLSPMIALFFKSDAGIPARDSSHRIRKTSTSHIGMFNRKMFLRTTINYPDFMLSSSCFAVRTNIM